MSDQPVEPRIQYIKALVNAQKKFKPVQKTGSNPYFKSKYAPYESVWESVGGPLNESGIAVSHKTVFENDKFFMVTRLQHESGHEETSIHIIQADKNDTMQSKGSAETYAKRYNLVALTAVPIVNEDDDGEEDRKQKEAKPPVAKAAQAIPLDQPKIYLNVDQCRLIAALIGENGDLFAKVLNTYKANELQEIEAKEFDVICNKLKARKEKK